MISVRREFMNEIGNQISILVQHDPRGVTISCFGPTSEVEHTYTPMEARVIRELLTLLEPAYKIEEHPI